MKKILMTALISIMPLSTSLFNLNLILKPSINISSNWLSSNESGLLNLIYSDNYLYEDKKINIKLVQNNYSQTVAEVYAKTQDQSYFLKIDNFQNYSQEKIINYVKNKFYDDKTTEHFLSGDDYFALFDTTKEAQGHLLNNAEVNIKSSWGVSNTSQSEGEVAFTLQEKTIKRHIMLNQESQFGKLKYRDIEIISVKPLKLGILPLVQVISTPIGEASWLSNSVSFTNSDFSQNLDSDWMNLILPEGAQSGQEFGNWFRQGGWSVILGSIGLITGLITTAGVGLALGVALFVIDALNSLRNSMNSDEKTLLPPKIFDGIKDIKKIYNRIMENSYQIYNSPEITWEDLPFNHFSTYLKGDLWGKAWSTSMFGEWSKMSLHTVWGALNADIKYLIYN